jgi:hypothetical protein
VFSAAIAAAPADWHMAQPVFVADLAPRHPDDDGVRR